MRNLAFITIVLISMVTVLPVIYAAFFTWPNVEDLELSIAARDTSVWRSMLNMSITYDGRYATNLFHATNPLVYNKIEWYKYIVLATLFMFLLGAYVAVGNVFERAKTTHKVIIALFFVSSILLSSPSLYFSLYSVCASYAYFYPCIFVLLAYVSVQRYLQATQRKFALFLLCTLLIFISVGFNEVFLPFFVILSLVIPGLLWRQDREKFNHLLPISVVTLVFIAFFITTPSALKKLDGEASFAHLPFVKNSLIIYVHVIIRYVASPITLLMFLSSYFLSHYHSRNIGSWTLVSMSLTALPYAMTLPFFMAYPTTEIINERVYIPVLFVQYAVLFFFVFPALWNMLLGRGWIRSSGADARIMSLSLICVAVLIGRSVYSGNGGSMGTLVSELKSGKIHNHNKRMSRNYAKLVRATGSNSKYEIVCVDETASYPKSIFSDQDSENNRRHSKWNRFNEAYFKVDEIRVLGPNVNKFTFDRR